MIYSVPEVEEKNNYYVYHNFVIAQNSRHTWLTLEALRNKAELITNMFFSLTSRDSGNGFSSKRKGV